ncbi:MAG: 4a-hydroxytetrahydrobiopterin dehydratase [bacterium]|nr:4a-hydroxytetrahydrobiopterin dehydratase [bacterium]
MKIHLTDKKCVACEGGTPVLSRDEIAKYQSEVPQWCVAKDGFSIFREFQFKDFKEAVAFLNKVAVLAEEEGHHPDMNLFGYKKLLITLSTHAIGGLSENDFILAAKISAIGGPASGGDAKSE